MFYYLIKLQKKWLQLEPTLHKTTKIVYNRTGSYAKQFDLEWLG